jgi:hypothetical protein
MRQTTFSEFLNRVSNPDAEWAKRATAHAQLESVRVHTDDIKYVFPSPPVTSVLPLLEIYLQ